MLIKPGLHKVSRCHSVLQKLIAAINGSHQSYILQHTEAFCDNGKHDHSLFFVGHIFGPNLNNQQRKHDFLGRNKKVSLPV